MSDSARQLAQPAADIRQLRYFVAVAEEHSYTRAAERLHVVQQSVSSTIKQLEIALGVQLLERTSRRVSLTVAGEALYEHATEVLVALERALDATRAAGGIAPRELKIGYNGALGRLSLFTLHREIHDRMPVANLSWRPRYNDELLAETLAGGVDIALSLFPDRVDGLDYKKLCELPVGVVVRRGDPLAGKESVTLGDFDGRKLLTIPRALGPRYYDEFVRMLRDRGAEVEFVDTPDPESGVIPPGVDGPVAGLAPLVVAREFAAQHREWSVCRPLDVIEASISFELVTRRTDGSEEIDQFTDICSDFARSLAAEDDETPPPDES